MIQVREHYNHEEVYTHPTKSTISLKKYALISREHNKPEEVYSSHIEEYIKVIVWSNSKYSPVVCFLLPVGRRRSK